MEGKWRTQLIPAVALAIAAALLSVDPITQRTDYHAFADDRTLLGIPNALDVLSNLSFLAAGLFGFRQCVLLAPSAVQPAWFALFIGITLVSVGSAYYHWSPDSSALLWDRLPMTIGFMGLYVALLAEFIDIQLARWLPAGLVVGALSVLYWHISNDLRPYIWVQTVPLISIPLLLALCRSRYTHAWMLLVALGGYVLAKVAELYDRQIFATFGSLISGHTIKHLLAAIACWVLADMLRRRRARS
jgi:hypothetical protein